MSKEDVENHAKTYSQSYKYDLREKKKSSVWSTNFAAMAKKTVMKQLLSKWGILSIEMQRAIQDDQKVYEASGEGTYADNQDEFIPAEDPFDAAVVMDAEYREVEDQGAEGENPETQRSASAQPETSENEEPEELDFENPDNQ